MKILNILIVIVIITPLSIFAQKDTTITIFLYDNTKRDTLTYQSTELRAFNENFRSIGVFKMNNKQYFIHISTKDLKTYQTNFDVKNDKELHDLIKNITIDDIKANEQRRINAQNQHIKALIGSPIPDFDAPDTSGYRHRPTQYVGRVLILHFWNFWDQSFEHEIPILNDILKKYSKDGLEILSFTDIPISDSEKKKLSKNPIDFTLISNARQFSREFINLKNQMPYIVIVDKKSHFRHFLINGELSWDIKNDDKKQKFIADFEEKIQSLLREGY